MTSSVATRVARLSEASARNVVEPDADLAGEMGPGQVIADSLLSVAGLDHGLSQAQRTALSREEVASIVGEGIRFEAVLGAGFNLQISKEPDLTDPRVVYALHELGEETPPLPAVHPQALRHEATRPVLAAAVHAGVFRPGRVPFLWRRLTAT